jgi:protein involved in polysaccharide export with SLBB domain
MIKHIARLMTVLMLWNTVGFAQTPSRTSDALGEEALSQVSDPTLVDIRGTRRLVHGLDGPIDPSTYVVGPSDEYALFIRGPRETRIALRVLPEGTVVLPNVGTLSVAGLTITEFRQLLAEKLAPYYRNVEFDCQLVLPRTMLVPVLGEVNKPGAVELFAPFRLDAALAGAGGVADRGSLRAIEIVSTSGVERRVDFQSYLRLGERAENPSLREGWSVFVPSRGPSCQVIGEVWNGGGFEVLSGETVGDLIALAGGPTTVAMTDRIVLERLDVDDRLTVREMTWEEAQSTPIASRDAVVLPDRRSFPGTAFVRVYGGGGREGLINIQAGETLQSFLPRFVRLKDDHNLSRAVLERKLPSGDLRYIPVDLDKVIAGEEGAGVVLEPGDVINIPPYEEVVFVVGEVNQPGPIPFQRGLTADRYVVLAGGPAGGGSIDRLEIISADGSKRKAGRNDTVYRGETVMVRQKKWRIFQQVFVSVTSLTSLVLSIYAVSRANNN